MAKGNLKVNVYSGSIANPVKGASVVISNGVNDIAQYITNEDGQTELIELNTVDKKYSEEEQYKNRPYETYDVSVSSFHLFYEYLKNFYY